MRNRAGIAIASLALGVVALAACGSSGTKTIETKDGKVTVNKNGGSVTIEGEKGSKATFGSTKLPGDFPSDVPLPKGLKLKSSASGSQSSKKFFTIGYELGSTSPEDAAAAYKTQLEDAGFTVTGNANFGGSGGTVNNVSAEGKGWRVAASGIGSTGGKLFTLVVTSAN